MAVLTSILDGIIIIRMYLTNQTTLGTHFWKRGGQGYIRKLCRAKLEKVILPPRTVFLWSIFPSFPVYFSGGFSQVFFRVSWSIFPSLFEYISEFRVFLQIFHNSIFTDFRSIFTDFEYFYGFLNRNYGRSFFLIFKN